MTRFSIRTAQEQDRRAIHQLYLKAFPDSESKMVAQLATELLHEKTDPPVFSQLTVNNEQILGHIAFSPVKIENEETLLAYILAPLAVSPREQGKGIGGKLIERGLEELSGQGVDLVFVYGDPDFYGKFGFEAEGASMFIAPYKLEYPFGWLVKWLKDPRRPNSQSEISCVGPLHNPALW